MTPWGPRVIRPSSRRRRVVPRAVGHPSASMRPRQSRGSAAPPAAAKYSLSTLPTLPPTPVNAVDVRQERVAVMACSGPGVVECGASESIEWPQGACDRWLTAAHHRRRRSRWASSHHRVEPGGSAASTRSPTRGTATGRRGSRPRRAAARPARPRVGPARTCTSGSARAARRAAAGWPRRPPRGRGGCRATRVVGPHGHQRDVERPVLGAQPGVAVEEPGVAAEEHLAGAPGEHPRGPQRAVAPQPATGEVLGLDGGDPHAARRRGPPPSRTRRPGRPAHPSASRCAPTPSGTRNTASVRPTSGRTVSMSRWS